MVTAIVMTLVPGAILGLGLGIVDRFLSAEVDEHIERVSSMLSNHNCGSCGYTGCSGFAEALVEGEITVVGTCKPCKPDQKAVIAEYLNTTPGPDGTCVKVKAQSMKSKSISSQWRTLLSHFKKNTVDRELHTVESAL